MPVDQVTFGVDLGAMADPSPGVGTVYEVGIDGVGYMLADNPEMPEQRYRRTITPLEPQRLATGETPYTEAVQRMVFASMVDGSGGRGQTFWDRSDADKKAYKDSYGFDPFTEPGKFKALPAMTQEVADTYANPRLVVVGSTLYVLTAANELTRISAPGGGETAFTIAAAGTVTDLTSDGAFWYAADGADIYRGTTADPGAAWSTQNAVSVQWAAGRLAAAVIASGATPNRFTTLTVAGLEERTNGHLTLDAGHTIVLGGVSNGYYYFGSYVGNKGLLWAWQLGLDDAGAQFFPFVAWELPDGLIPVSLGTGGGNVFLKLLRPSGASQGQVLLYRAVPTDNGSVTAFLIDEIQAVGGTVDHSYPARMATHGDQVLFPWPTMIAGRSGVGAIDLASGGYAKWLNSTVTGHIGAIDVWQGYTVFGVQGNGAWTESSTVFETEARLDMSIVDGKTSLAKVLDKVTLVFDPLQVGQALTVALSVDGGLSYSTLGTVNTPGTTRSELWVDTQADSFGLRVTATTGGTARVTILLHEMMYHMLGLADLYIQLPINCADNITLLNQRPHPGNRRGAGMARARALQNLTQTRVLFQDIDWWLTGLSEIWEVVSVDVMSTHLYDRRKGGTLAEQVAVLTLRKDYHG